VLRVLYRDATLVAFDKPSGVSLLADRSGAPCLWDAIRAELAPLAPLAVHRLDKGTSGVLLVALERTRQAALSRALAQRLARKWYVANVVGELDLDRTGTIDLPLAPGRKSRYRVAGRRSDIARRGARWSLERGGMGGHQSVTRLRVLVRGRGRTRLVLHPLTGRTHQLRVHLAWIGHPIVGDRLYGRPDDASQRAERLELHCHRISVPGLLPTVTAPFPPELLERNLPRT
jgi:tRNA pseudouridine32 synthase/23S rRNA pseudouridine746 synthase/23S rRNA pseudouridine1911/1915/1917 synthase